TLDSAVQVAFDAEIQLNDFSPVQVKFTNRTTGGSSYSWTFEGGEPAASEEPAPPPVTFTTPGPHEVTLQVSNGGQTFSLSKTITGQPPLSTDFELKPSFHHDDYDAALTAILESKGSSYLTQQWQSSGGVLNSDPAASTTLFLQDPGTYTITLKSA